MGQAITVTVRPGVRGDVRHFELNRSLTGMQTHRYTAAEIGVPRAIGIAAAA